MILLYNEYIIWSVEIMVVKTAFRGTSALLPDEKVSPVDIGQGGE
jgi:hypothetical protein